MGEIPLEVPHHGCELGSIDQFQWFPFGKCQRLIGVDPAGDENGAVGSLRCHHPIKLADRFDPNLIRPPAFALDNRFLTIPMQQEVDPAISSAPANFIDMVSLLAVHLSDLMFKILPTQFVEPADIDGFGEECLSSLMDNPPPKAGGQTDHGENPGEK